MESESGFERYGNAELHKRYTQNANSVSRKKCHCGCGKRARKLGMANGVCLSIGCDLYIRRWVRDGVNARTPNVQGEGQTTAPPTTAERSNVRRR